MAKTLFLFFLSCLFIPAILANSDTLHVKLISSAEKKSLETVAVKVEGKDTTYFTDQNGCLILTDLTPGKYTLKINGAGYRVNEQKVEKKHFGKDTLKVKMIPYWTLEGSQSLNFAQNAFGNYWQQGGVNSFAIRGEVNLTGKYKRQKSEWENSFSIKHGMIKQGEYQFITDQDMVEVNSKFGRKFTEKLLGTALLNAKSQIRKGYKIEKDGKKGALRSDFLAPGYFHLGSGMDLKLKELGISVYYSPIDSKITLVLDTMLSELYMPKDLIGQTSRYELGSYLKVKYNKEILKNVTLQTNADFFANHLKNFGSVDVNWETKMAFKVNKYLTANILTHLIYDEDILFEIQEPDNPDPSPNLKKGPRTQFHQALNIGVTHKF
ncbi:MAG: DUF3078 domain-containing protein [Bacteroidetes bacterium]|nr:DUF3078 domain-containing protein [Bacteroidota bacterium]